MTSSIAFEDTKTIKLFNQKLFVNAKPIQTQPNPSKSSELYVTVWILLLILCYKMGYYTRNDLSK